MSDSVKRKLAVLLEQTSPLRTPQQAHTRRHRTTTFGTPRAPLGLSPKTTPSAVDQELVKSMIASAPKRPTTYNPWSRTEFLKRLATYTYRTWLETPSSDETEGLTPVDCVARGWKSVAGAEGGSTLQCVHCHALLTIKFPEPLANNADEDDEEDKAAAAETHKRVRAELVRRYKEDLLVTAHRQSCPWRQKGCDGQVYSPLRLTGAVVSGVKHRALALSALDGTATLRPVKTGLDVQDEVTLVRKLRERLGLDDSCDDTALLYAVYGWGLPDGNSETSGTSRPAFLECNMCFRRVLLPSNPSTNTTEDEEDQEQFDLAAEHQAYCAYLDNFVSQFLSDPGQPISATSSPAPASPSPALSAKPTSSPAAATDNANANTDNDNGTDAAYDVDQDLNLRARFRRLKQIYSSPVTRLAPSASSTSTTPFTTKSNPGSAYTSPAARQIVTSFLEARPLGRLGPLPNLPAPPDTPTRKGR